MGLPMADHLLRASAAAGGTFLLHGRSPEKAEPLMGRGARWAGAPAGLAGADVILSMLPDLEQLEPIVFGSGCLADAVRTRTVLAIGSTSSPDGVRWFGEQAARRTGGLLRVIDAPVSGGTEGATAGTLSIMVGGDDADVADVRPVLDALGTAVHLGPLGSGQVAKACNQAIVAATVLALGEAAVLAERSGLDVEALFGLLAGGYAGSRVLETRGERIVRRDYRVAGPAKYMVKDLGFALAEARRTATALPQTSTTLAAFTELVARGLGDDDIAITRAFIESLEPEV
ncbi:NAD(P)-dependent oxidoreductase [Agromyces archimandritae]|uniref:NAD(P)-dependent oxidoreductase n=2 Tax=Agromyces archimandritae TaxID=2781962 RepID=A0A975FPJ5_9MICO|nr:NAD(P)-dependent oxidoreductase [Agromyces archimandritae]